MIIDGAARSARAVPPIVVVLDSGMLRVLETDVTLSKPSKGLSHAPDVVK